MSQTFPTSRLIEKLKLASDSRPASLKLSFTEDRALTALQLLLAQKSFRALTTRQITPEARERWGCNEPVPVMFVPTLEFSKAYTQDRTTSNEVSLSSLRALKSLARKSFTLSWLADGSEYAANSALIDVRQYILADRAQPKYLLIALSPPLVQGVYPELNDFVIKQSNQFYRIDQALGSGAGHRSEVTLRLIAWLSTLSTQASGELSILETTLIHRLGLASLRKEGLKKFRLTMSKHLSIIQQVGLIKSFRQPKVGREMWTLIRIPQKFKVKKPDA